LTPFIIREQEWASSMHLGTADDRLPLLVTKNPPGGGNQAEIDFPRSLPFWPRRWCTSKSEGG